MGKTINRAGCKIKIDDWGGVVFELPEDADETLSVDPEIMDEIERIREAL